jgi:hypothetical protein
MYHYQSCQSLNLSIIDLQLLSTKFELLHYQLKLKFNYVFFNDSITSIISFFHMCFWIEMILLQDKMGSRQCYMCCLLNKHLLFIERTLLYF